MIHWENNFTKVLKISYPFIQAPMLGVTTPQMVAAISNAGGLGSLPVGGLSANQTKNLIQQTKALTKNPFAVNLFANEENFAPQEDILAMQHFLENFAAENKIPFTKNNLADVRFNSYHTQIPILVEENIPVVSFTFGIPDSFSVDLLKKHGATLIGTATSLKEGQRLEANCADAIVAQGLEAGGHRGSFLQEDPLPLIPAVTLTKILKEEIQLPIITAGGLYNGNAISNAFKIGASAVQLGTSFITSSESAAIPAFKSRLMNYSMEETMLTKAYTGKWARGIRTKFLTAIEKSGLAIPGYPVQQALTNAFRQYGLLENTIDYLPLWAGQFNSQKSIEPAAVIFKQLIKDAEANFKND